MSKGDVEAALEAADLAATKAPVELQSGKRYAFVLPGVEGGDSAKVVQIDTLASSASPERAKGTVQVTTADGFETAVRGRIEPLEPRFNLYAEVKSMSLVGVLNDDHTESPGWRDERVVLRLERTPEWDHWRTHQGLTDQQAFAEAIEAGIDELVEPSPADMLEVAQKFEASVGARFKTVNRLRDGSRQLLYEEDVEASAGEVRIPEEFVIRLAPFFGSATEDVRCRLKFRMGSGKLTIGYELIKPHNVERSAFESVVTDVAMRLDRHPIEGIAPTHADGG